MTSEPDVHHGVRRSADRPRSQARACWRRVHQRRRDRGGDGDRVRPRRPAHRGRGAGPSRQRLGAGGRSEVGARSVKRPVPSDRPDWARDRTRPTPRAAGRGARRGEPAPRRHGRHDAFASSFHFSREVSRGTGEAPVALRRRVMLERAAWRIAGGMIVTDAACEAGYDSVEGFSRAFDEVLRRHRRAPSRVRGDVRAHWLAAPNGVHFHPPLNLWVHDSEETSLMHVAAQLFQHDLDDTTHLIEVVAGSPRRGLPPRGPARPDRADVGRDRAVRSEPCSTTTSGARRSGSPPSTEQTSPTKGADDPAALRARHEAIAPRWLEVVRDVERRDAWDDRLIDALCEPPECFQVGSVLAHVLSFGAHRRQLVRLMLRAGRARDRRRRPDHLAPGEERGMTTIYYTGYYARRLHRRARRTRWTGCFKRRPTEQEDDVPLRQLPRAGSARWRWAPRRASGSSTTRRGPARAGSTTSRPGC